MVAALTAPGGSNPHIRLAIMFTSKTLPSAHQRLLTKIISILSRDGRILGIAASGSYSSDSMDKYSDIDLVVAIEPATYDQVVQERFELIQQIDGYIAAFTGEHVGEPRLIIAIYGPELVHVDFKFVDLPSVAQRVDNTEVLWERETLLSDIFKRTSFAYPQPDIQWIEDRFWIWIHYAATKIGRGEYFEALEFLSFLRTTVLSPLALKQKELTPSGVRNIETRLPEFAEKLRATITTHDKASLSLAFRKAIEIYLELRSQEEVEVNELAYESCLKYFESETK